MLYKIIIEFISDYLHILMGIDIILFCVVLMLFKKSFESLSEKLIKNKIGLLGELRVLNELKSLELPLLHDVYIPMANSANPTQIDILVRFYDSILVVEVKNIGGYIKGKLTDPKWLSTKGRSKHAFYNPIMQNNVHCHGVTVIGDNRIKLQSAIVFCGNVKFGESMPSNVFTLKSFMEYVRILKKAQRPKRTIFGHKTSFIVEETWAAIRSGQGWFNKRKLIKQHKATTIKKYYQKITALKKLCVYLAIFIAFLILTYLQYTGFITPYIDLIVKYINIVIQYFVALYHSFA